MKLILNQNEFQEVRRFVSNSQNRDIINGYNKLFDANSTIPVKGVVLPKTRDIVIEVGEKESVEMLKVIADNGTHFGEMLRKDFSISAVPKWVAFIKSVGAAIGNLFTT